MRPLFYVSMVAITICGMWKVAGVFVEKDMAAEKTKASVGPIHWEHTPVRIEGVEFGVLQIKENGKRYLYVRSQGGGTVLEQL